MILIVVLYEIFEVVAGLGTSLPIIGPALILVNFLGDWIIWLIIQFWLIMKGEKGLWFLAGSAAEMIPLIDILPIRTITLLITILMAKALERSAEEEPTAAPTEKLTEAEAVG